MSCIGRILKSVGKIEIRLWVEELQAIQVFGQHTQNRDLDQVVLDGCTVWSL